MAIQFSCPICSKSLRVNDEHAGKSARCPDCSNVVSIPGQKQMPPVDGGPQGPGNALPSNPFAGSAPVKSQGAYEANPFSSPASVPHGSRRRGKPLAIDGPIVPRAVGIEEVVSPAWRLWQENLGILAGVGAVTLGISFFTGLVSGFAGIFILETTNDQVMAYGVEKCIDLIGSLISIFLGIGTVRINLNIARGKPVEFGMLFSGGDRFLPLVGASFVAYICLVLGLLMLVVPGILMLLFCWAFYFVVVDEKAGAMDSFAVAYSFGKLNVGTTFLLWLISIPIILAGCAALGIGLIFAVPLYSMILTVAYLKMTGQWS